MANKTITAPEGFISGAFACGVKSSGKLDLGIIHCPQGAKAAGVFTTNKVVSAAVTVCAEHIKRASTKALVVNAGNANTCTGKQGEKDARLMCETVAKQLGLKAEDVLIASTGIIGRPLPMSKITTGIKKATSRLSSSAEAGQNFAKAIMTTDTRPKQATCKLKISGQTVTIAGTVKGSGMIAPNMATTICVITTDVAITKPLLASALQAAIGNSLNKLSIDGHQSTNDTAVILASGAADNRPITAKCPRYKKFAKALTLLAGDLAKQMVLDAEGATRMFRVVVTQAASGSEAAKAARAVANYDLVKCAVHGSDPNWGRIICAVGSCGVKLNPSKLSCKIGNITVFKNGRPAKFSPAKASKVISKKEHTITVSLGVGTQSDFCYGCDLSRGYIRINADYHT